MSTRKVETTELATREEQTGELAIASANAQAQHEIQSAIIIAQRFRRNEDLAYAKLMKAASRPAFAEEALYSFPRGDATVEGPSVNMAREAARVWGNIRYGVSIIRDDDETRHIQAWAWDVETNTKATAEDNFKKLVFRKNKGWIVPDERDLRELTNRRGAIALRNCLLNLIPKDVIEDAVEAVKKTMQSGAKADPDVARKKIVTAFSAIGISPEDLEKKLGHTIAQCTADEVSELRGIYKSIADGNSKWGEYLPKDGPVDASAETTTLRKPEKKQEGAQDDPDAPPQKPLMLRDVMFAAGKNGWTEDQIGAIMEQDFGVKTMGDLNTIQLRKAHEFFTSVKAPSQG